MDEWYKTQRTKRERDIMEARSKTLINERETSWKQEVRHRSMRHELISDERSEREESGKYTRNHCLQTIFIS
jgi:hypothetical protein